MKPLLAASIDSLETLRFPLYASRKVDGIRAITYRSTLLSRTLKPIRNRAVQRALAFLPDYVDGELILLTHEGQDAPFNLTSSFFMSEHGVAPKHWAWEYRLFDYFTDKEAPYESRLEQLQNLPIPATLAPVKVLPQTFTTHVEQVLKLEADALALGAEGLILRSPSAPYKYGRSTLREQALLKLKRFADAEAVVVGFTEALENTNTPFENALGLTERPTDQSGLTPKGYLGALIVKAINGQFSGVEFSIGSGFTLAQRQALWHNPPLGEVITFKYQPCGSLNAPRLPIFKAFRLD